MPDTSGRVQSCACGEPEVEGKHAEAVCTVGGSVLLRPEAEGRTLSPALLRLGQMIVAEHTVGHRVVGEVRGFGLTGAILYVHSPGEFQPAFLSADDGWTFTPQEEHPDV